MQIKHKGITVNGGRAFEITWDDGKVEEKSFIGTRCGISWPMAENPGGYFLIVGQETVKKITGEYPLFIVSEFVGQTLTGLFEKMFDAMGLFGCFEIFTEIAPRFMSCLRELDGYKRANRNLQDVKIKHAPHSDDFILGKNSIDTWVKVTKYLTIPRDFTIYSQLIHIREDDLKGEPQNKWFAINALRYVLCAFETSSIPESTKNREVGKGVPPGAWN